MQDLVDQLDEQYQDIEYQGKFYKGLRNCEERWNLFKDHIKPHDVVLDLGSSLGYYSKKIAQTYPDSLVISFESDPIMCEIQKQLFEDEGIYNVVVCNYRLGVDDLNKWFRHVELFDTVLALAVLHHYPAEDVGLVIELLLHSEKLIVENGTEEKACGGNAKQRVAETLGTVDGTWLGDVKSHLQGERSIVMYPGGVSGTNLDAFFGVSHPDRHRFEVEGGKINGKHIIKGINVWNLLHFNVVWPTPHWWIVQAKAAYEGLSWKSDVRPWNLLITPTGLKAIDFTTHFPQNDQAEFRTKDIEKLSNLFSQMKPIKWEDL